MQHNLDRRRYQYPRYEKSDTWRNGIFMGDTLCDMQTAEKGAVGCCFLDFFGSNIKSESEKYFGIVAIWMQSFKIPRTAM